MCVYIYIYICIYIYTYFLSLKMLFLQREKLLPAFGPEGEKRNLKNNIHLRINVMVAAKLTGRNKTKQNSKARWKSSMKELHYLETVCDPVN